MSKTDFEAIAHTLDANVAPIELVLDMADTLESSNPRFNRALFIQAATIRLLDVSAYNANRVAKIHGVTLNG